MQNDMAAYYGRRAKEYERVYAKPERRDDLIRLRASVGMAFKGHEVLEVACGTGYWTEVIAPVASSVLACDVSPEVLEIARGKPWGAARVEFHPADAYALPDFGRRYSAAFAGFWWSHMPKRKIAGFLTAFHAHLAPGAEVVFIDNRYVAGNSTPISRTDEAGNTFQQRRLDDGSVHEVLKNFPTEAELLQAVAGLTSSAEVLLTDYFWVLNYRLL